MQGGYYDRDGRPVSRRQWQQLGRQPGYTRVDHAAITRHGWEITVATFWLGTADGGGPGDRLIFASYGEIRRPGGRQAACRRTWGWPGLQAARAGHQAVTAWLGQVAAWLAGQASQLPAPPAPAAPVAPAGERRGEQPADGCRLLVCVRQQPGYTLVTAAGKIGSGAAGQLRARLGEAVTAGRPVIADLDRVSFIDAAGLDALAAAARQARTLGASLHVVAAAGPVRRLFALTGLDQAIPPARTIAEAAAALSPSLSQGTAGTRAARLKWLRQQYALSRWAGSASTTRPSDGGDRP